MEQLDDKLDEMVVECYDDQEKRDQGMQARSQNCLSKLRELQKIDGWRTAVDKVF